MLSWVVDHVNSIAACASNGNFALLQGIKADAEAALQRGTIKPQCTLDESHIKT